MDSSTVTAFLAAATILLVVPGPAVTYVVARSLQDGRRAGLVSVAGLHLGTAVHVLAAVLGLSALLVSSAQAYTAIRWAGALYLIYLGVRSLLFHREAVPTGATPTSLRKAFTDGVLVNVLNPKLAVFFLAFLPQFVDPASGPVAVQLMSLGVLFIAIGLVTDAAYAVAADAVARRFGPESWLVRRRAAVAGVTYLSLGALSLALPGRRT